MPAMDPLTIHNSPETIAARTSAIHAAMLRDSLQMRQPNFTIIGTDDLALLFRLYDEQFFAGWLAQSVREKAAGPVHFRLSSTMSRAGGKTIRHRTFGPAGASHVHFEIAIASRLLFMTFGDIARPIIVCGLICTDRLQAMQRIMEHELIHLTELLLWGNSSCSAPPFRALANRVFGHTQSTHDLVTPREHAALHHGIRIGSMVRFEFDHVRLVGRVNRISRRATVLVESDDGVPYSDGKAYRKFYVPLSMLTLADAPAPLPEERTRQDSNLRPSD